MKKHATVWKKVFSESLFPQPLCETQILSISSLITHLNLQSLLYILTSSSLSVIISHPRHPHRRRRRRHLSFFFSVPFRYHLRSLHSLHSITFPLSLSPSPPPPFLFFSSFPVKKRSDWERHSVRIAGSRWRLSAPADSLCRSDLSPLH